MCRRVSDTIPVAGGDGPVIQAVRHCHPGSNRRSPSERLRATRGEGLEQ
jgi:hypothetical protein